MKKKEIDMDLTFEDVEMELTLQEVQGMLSMLCC
jgi:hypothetical protein